MNVSAPCILVVEDEAAQREVLRYNLSSEGYDVVIAEDGDAALILVKELIPDLVVLDWMLPDVSGIEICRQIKSCKDTRQIPVIMLSARSEETDRVRGLETGADDYVTKPYSIAELTARVRTQLRRTRPTAMGSHFEYAGIVIDSETHRVTRCSKTIELTPTEFRLLATLIEKPGRVWSREQLLDRVWGRDVYLETRTVDVHVGRLRKVLGKHGGKDLLRTIRGIGYALE